MWTPGGGRRAWPRADRAVCFRVVGVLILLVASSCGGDRGAPDAAADAAEADAGPGPRSPRALILDHALRHPSTWVDVIEGLADVGVDVTYRRHYPHLTVADAVPAADGERPPWDVVILAAGDAPTGGSSRTRMEEVDNAVRFAEAGGVLVLAARAGVRDGFVGDNDWFVHNRILEELDVDMRIGRGILLGATWAASSGEAAPPHVVTAAGYPTTLEPRVGYAFAETSRGSPTGASVTRVALGVAPRLHVASPEVEVLLRTLPGAFEWRHLGGEEATRVVRLDGAVPAAAVAPAGRGYVVALGRGTLTLSAVTGLLSDKPAHDSTYERAGREWVRGLLAWLAELAGGAPLRVTQPLPGDALFRVAADGILPEPGPGEVLGVASAIATRDVPARPPEGRLDAPLPGRIDRGAAAPAWLRAGGGRVAYGELPPRRADVPIALAEVAAHGYDAWITFTTPGRLHGYGLDTAALDDERALYAEVASHVSDAGVRWIVGDTLTAGQYALDPDAFPRMVAASGRVEDAPAPLDEDFWDTVVLPTYREVGALSRAHPGIFGLLLDLELYGGPIHHTDGHAFSDSTVRAFLSAWRGEGLGELAERAPGERLDWLVDRGRLGDYFDTLEGLAFARGDALRRAAHARAPDLWFLVALPLYPTTWLYHGLLRGLGTPERPVVLLTHEAWDGRAGAVLAAEGVHVVHLGGAVVRYFRPEDVGDVVLALSGGGDGYFLRTFDELSAAYPTPAGLHGAASEYWSAIDAAHEALSGDRGDARP